MLACAGDFPHKIIRAALRAPTSCSHPGLLIGSIGSFSGTCMTASGAGTAADQGRTKQAQLLAAAAPNLPPAQRVLLVQPSAAPTQAASAELVRDGQSYPGAVSIAQGLGAGALAAGAGSVVVQVTSGKTEQGLNVLHLI